MPRARPRLLPGAYRALGPQDAAASSSSSSAGHATSGTVPRPPAARAQPAAPHVTSGRPGPGPGCGSRKNAWPAEGDGGGPGGAASPLRARAGGVETRSPGPGGCVRPGWRGGVAGGGSGGAPERPLTKAPPALPPARSLAPPTP